MALIIENGNQIPNANSYVTDLEYTDYAASKGLTVAATAELREIDLFAGMDYILSQESCLQGRRVSSTQEVSFPRVGVYVYDNLVQSHEIHVNVKKAQMEAAPYATAGTLLSNTESTNRSKEKVDVLEVEYFKGGKRSNVNLQRVNSYLDPLLIDTTKLVRT